MHHALIAVILIGCTAMNVTTRGNSIVLGEWSYPGLVDSFAPEISGRSFHLIS